MPLVQAAGATMVVETAPAAEGDGDTAAAEDVTATELLLSTVVGVQPAGRLVPVKAEQSTESALADVVSAGAGAASAAPAACETSARAALSATMTDGIVVRGSKG